MLRSAAWLLQLLLFQMLCSAAWLLQLLLFQASSHLLAASRRPAHYVLFLVFDPRVYSPPLKVAHALYDWEVEHVCTLQPAVDEPPRALCKIEDEVGLVVC